MPITSRLRIKIFERDNYTCVYCRIIADKNSLHVDHIYPSSKGGLDVPTNLVTACEQCNIAKSDKILENPPVVADILLDAALMFENNKYTQRERTTEEDHEYLKENYKRCGFKSAAAFLECIIKFYQDENADK